MARIFLLALFSMSPHATGACIELDSGRIRASDLAARFPAFAAITGSTDLGPAPIPGVQRWMFAPELAQLARRHGFAAQPGDLREICLKTKMEQLTGEAVRAAIDKSLTGWEPTATFEIDGHSKYDVPAGTVEFPLSGLARIAGAASPAPMLWKGRVVHGERNSFPVWAKVRIHAEKDAVVALADLPPGKPISGEMVGIERRAAVPGGPKWVTSVSEVAGTTPRRLIQKGEPLTSALAVSRLDVERGQHVEVRVSAGGAQLGFTAVAESDGRAGEFVTLRNPLSGKRFKGQVVAKAKVAVTVENERN